jgi:hypothetical protein
MRQINRHQRQQYLRDTFDSKYRKCIGCDNLCDAGFPDNSFGPIITSNVPELFGHNVSPLTNQGLAEPTGSSCLLKRLTDFLGYKSVLLLVLTTSPPVWYCPTES